MTCHYCVSIHAAAALIVCTILSGCASSQEQGPHGPAENIPVITADIAEINEVLAGYRLMAIDDLPVLVGPQR